MQFAVKELLKYKMHKEDKYISTITCLTAWPAVNVIPASPRKPSVPKYFPIFYYLSYFVRYTDRNEYACHHPSISKPFLSSSIFPSLAYLK